MEEGEGSRIDLKKRPDILPFGNPETDAPDLLCVRKDQPHGAGGGVVEEGYV